MACHIPRCLTSCLAPVENKIYVMYHGTNVADAHAIRKCGFCQSKDGTFGPGVYVTRSLDKASRYPLDLDNRQKIVLQLLVNAGKVKKIDYHGFDTAWCPPRCGKVKSGLCLGSQKNKNY